VASHLEESAAQVVPPNQVVPGWAEENTPGLLVLAGAVGCRDWNFRSSGASSTGLADAVAVSASTNTHVMLMAFLM